MHVVFRESHGLEGQETPQDLGQTPAELVVLSFSDSDLGAFAEGWHSSHRNTTGLPRLRLANLAQLKHPLSVDTYMENTLGHAKGVLIRLIGGVPYWSYGLTQLLSVAQERGIAVAVLPADGRDDPQLADYSTVPASTLKRLKHLCDMGGARAAQAALAQLALAAGIYAKPLRGAKIVAPVGAWDQSAGPACPAPALWHLEKPRHKLALVFYRSFVLAADTAPIAALKSAFEARHFQVQCYFVPSLKAPEAARWLSRHLCAFAPNAILNATSFSGLRKDGTSALDAANVPVFQIALATNAQKAWAKETRGLSPADLAMHVVLPEVDGRLFAGVASFKEPTKRDSALEFSRVIHQPMEDRIGKIVKQIEAWCALGGKKPSRKKLGFVLSSYPGKPWQIAHAVGLDALASTEHLFKELTAQGYAMPKPRDLVKRLKKSALTLELEEYQKLLRSIPKSLRDQVDKVWGPPEADPYVKDGAFHFTALCEKSAVVAVQPNRGHADMLVEDYHDLERVPCHSYIGFYLMLRKKLRLDSLIHMGAHGTLEWLPGKSVALSKHCWPEVLLGSLPVIYPFIVNDPGEAAQAKRRIGAITLGHAPPAMRAAHMPETHVHLEMLLDEFSSADGLDPKRRNRLIEDITKEALRLDMAQSLGIDASMCPSEAIARIDRFVCDLKESQYGDGLHIFGAAHPAQTEALGDICVAQSEIDGLMAALSGRRVAAGPSGSPYRGRRDVLPTGRNLYTTDPRMMPTRAAYENGKELAEVFIRHHLQENGEYPSGVVVDLWGSASLRTAGEEFAMALHLIGVKPKWDAQSERVSGFEITPIAEMDHPRIDVTLRVSGLFRDMFSNLSALFAQAVDALGARDEAPDFNPFVAQKSLDRVYGPQPGKYGLGMDKEAGLTDAAFDEAAKAWLNASNYALGKGEARADPQGIAARVAQSDSFVHIQDLRESDVLLANDYAAHEGGFAAAKAVLGGDVTLYHLDSTEAGKPRSRLLSAEIARVVHARAAQPAWLTGMMRHGFRGAAEIAATLDHLALFAHLARNVPSTLFDTYFDATLNDPEVSAFLQKNNPQAFDAMRSKFHDLMQAGLWSTRRNSIPARLEELS